MSAAEKKSTPNSNQSTEKAMALLELLAQSRTPMRLRDISDALGLNPSTALRFLTALQQCGYVSQEETSQRYQLTYKLCYLANQLTSHVELPTVTHPYLVSLAEQLHEAVCISVEREMTMVYIDVAAGPNQTLMSLQRIGNTSPMHCTGNGKLRLLTYSEEDLDRLIRVKGLFRMTPNTITTKERLLRELEQIRREDVAYDNEECEQGVRCMACPIRDYTGTIVAGISVTGPASRMTDEAVHRFLGRLRQTAAAISATLGYQGTTPAGV